MELMQPSHLIFVLLIALIVLGPKRLPEVGRALGRGIRDFRDAMSSDDRDRPEPVLTGPEPAPTGAEQRLPGPEPEKLQGGAAEHTG
jgi:sec-independent protein translocase protein TatA